MKRSYAPELMDDFSIQDKRIDIALNELKIINKFLGGLSTSRSALKYFIYTKEEILDILDIGSVTSENLLAAKKHYPYLKIFSIDKNVRALRSFPNSTIKINADAFRIPVKDNSCDIVHLSLFIHHFTEQEIIILLKIFLRVGKRGIIINDLQRSFIALFGIRILTYLFSKSELVRKDAPLSVKRGFKKNELVRLLTENGITNYVIKRKWAFRWMIVIKK